MENQDFIGRKTELRKINELVRQPDKRFLIAIDGHGGVGKTRLLWKIYEDYGNEAGFFCFKPVDFSQTRTRTPTWLRKEILDNISTGFHKYRALRINTHSIASVSTESVSQEEIRETFLDDFLVWEGSISKRPIFLFDTLELIKDTLLMDFLLDIAQTSQNSVFILAGRELDTIWPTICDQLEAAARDKIVLKGLSKDDTLEYIQWRNAGLMLSKDEQLALYELAEEGIPIKLAMALDWLSHGMVMEALLDHSLEELRQRRAEKPEEFRQILLAFEGELISHISELGTDVDEAIYIMAYVTKRLDPDLLQLLMPSKSKVDTHELFEKIKSGKHRFIKVFEPDPTVLHDKIVEPGYIVLHDEVQRMITSHIWAWNDTSHEKRRALGRKVIEYYDRRIAGLQASEVNGAAISKDRKVWRIFQIERLHYQLDVDLVDGYREFTRLFEELEDRREIDEAALAIDVAVKSGALPRRLREFVSIFYGGWLMTRLKPDRALPLIEEGIISLGLAEEYQTDQAKQTSFEEQEVDDRTNDCYTLLGYCHRLLGNWKEAFDYYEKARKASISLITRLRQVSKPNPDAIEATTARLAETLNDIANLQRMRGHLDSARSHAKLSLLIRERLDKASTSQAADLETVTYRKQRPNYKRLTGHCCYVMGMTMWDAGYTLEAMEYLEKARTLYQQTGDTLHQKAWIDRFEGYIVLRTGDFITARRLLENALDGSREIDSLQDEHAETLLYLSQLDREENPSLAGLNRALAQAEFALRIAEADGNDYRIAEAHYTICRVLDQIHVSNPDPGLPNKVNLHLRKGKEKAEKQQYTRLEILFFELEADLAFARQDYLLSIDKYFAALSKATQPLRIQPIEVDAVAHTQFVSASEVSPATFTRLLSNLSQKFYDLLQKDPDQALDACRWMQQKWQTTKYPQQEYREVVSELVYVQAVAQNLRQQNILNRRIIEELQNGTWQRVLTTCDNAARIPIDLHPYQSDLNQRRAEVYYAVNNYAEARMFCERAIRIRSDYGRNPKLLGDSYILRSRIYWALGNTARAIDSLDLAEAEYQKADSTVGLGTVMLDRGFISLRMLQFSQARERLASAHDTFRQSNEPGLTARALFMMSQLARLDPYYQETKEVGYQKADRQAKEALDILGNRDRSLGTEIYLHLSALHLTWGRELQEATTKEAAQEHFARVRNYLSDGWRMIESSDSINSPTLQSRYRGMQASLYAAEGDAIKARRYFIDELETAIKARNMRSYRTLDKLEDWLISLPVADAEEHGQWLLGEWRDKGFSVQYPYIEAALRRVVIHRPYIPEVEKNASDERIAYHS